MLEAADVDEGGIAAVFGHGHGVVHVVAQLGARVEEIERSGVNAECREVIAQMKMLLAVEHRTLIEFLEAEAEQGILQEIGEREDLAVVGKVRDKDHTLKYEINPIKTCFSTRAKP